MSYYCAGCRMGSCKICVRYINQNSFEKCTCEGGYHKLNPELEKNTTVTVKEAQPKPKSKTKQDLENKIKELEGKLSTLSDQLGKKEEDDNHDPYPPYYSYYDHPLNRPYGLRARSRYRQTSPPPRPRKSGTLPKGFGSHTTDELKKMEREYEQQLKNRSSGTLPKGFGSGYGGPYAKIMKLRKKEAKKLYKLERCLGCNTDVKDANKHYILCKDCTDTLQDKSQFNSAIYVIKKLGLKEKSKSHGLKGIMVKFGLAKEKKKIEQTQ